MQVQQIQDVHSAQRVAQPSAELRIGSTGDVMAMAAPKCALVETATAGAGRLKLSQLWPWDDSGMIHDDPTKTNL